LPLLDKKGIARNIEEFRRRRESLLAVDDLVKGVVKALDHEGVLNNTIIIFTSDNGWSQGAHRYTGKLLAYEESNRVPLIIRWPGMPANQVRDQLVTNLDVVATIIEQTMATPGNELDGRSLKSIIGNQNAPWRTAFLVQGIILQLDFQFLAVRTKDYILSENISSKYGNNAEFYDLAVDPYELINRAGSGKYKPTIDFLHNLLKDLSSCKGENCWVTAKPPP
jgi:arylsulfatase A-like enzyme